MIKKIKLPQKAVEEFREIYNDINTDSPISINKAKELAENFAELYLTIYAKD